jgi:glucan biosynthesis protein C
MIRRIYETLMRSPLVRPVLFAFLTFAFLLCIQSTWPEKIGTHLPAWKALCNYFSFYLFGWLLYGSRQLVAGFASYSGTLTAVASVLFLVKTVFSGALDRTVIMGLNALAVWCFIFGITGLFLRYFSGHSKTMRFISDASYWFYLIHLPLTALGAGLLIGSGLPSGIKFVLVLGGTTALCWVTYFYLVRSTFVGQFLNGRKYPRG